MANLDDPEAKRVDGLWSWDEILRTLDSANETARLQALGHARIHLKRFLGQHGVRLSKGTATRAINRAHRKGVFNDQEAFSLKEAVRIRNRCEYKGADPMPSLGDVRSAILSIHRACAPKEEKGSVELSEDDRGLISEVIGGALLGAAALMFISASFSDR